MDLIEALNIGKIELTEKEFCVTMKLSNFHKQPFGYINGGAIIAFSEIVSGQASNLLGKKEYYAVGQTITAHHIKSKKSEGYLYAKGELLHKGRRSHVWNINVVDEEDNLISQVTVVNALIKNPL